MKTHIRPAEAHDAAELVALARAVSAEPEGWLLADSDWRSVTTNAVTSAQCVATPTPCFSSRKWRGARRSALDLA
jgi:hypothetical protein